MTDLADVPVHPLADDSVALVKSWLQTARHIPVDSSAAQLAQMLRDSHGLEFTVGFVDKVIRPEDPAVAADEFIALSKNVPAFVPMHLRAAMKTGAVAARATPGTVISMVRRSLRDVVSHLLVDARDDQLGDALAKIRTPGVRLNLNLLGEAVLGAQEAQHRLEGAHRLLGRDDVDYVSVKVSSCVPPHEPWAFDEAIDSIVSALKPLFHRACATVPAKFINLDMEEYHDLDLTVAVFTRLMDIEGFTDLEAGIVLQAYLPDCLGAMMKLQQWAAARVARGGAPIKVRVVKGANLPIERVDADQHGWPCATWPSKAETDASYLSVLDWALTPEHTRNVRVGVAGHNLFHLAWAWLTADQRGVSEAIDVEMLLGMAPGQAEAVRRTVGRLLLYTPVVHPDEFDVAISYLIRRLEEGASSDNFMSAVFELDHDPELFDREQKRFELALSTTFTEPPPPNRTQNRTTQQPTAPTRFANCPNTDPSLPANRDWALRIITASISSTTGQAEVDQSTITTPEALDGELRRAVAASAGWAVIGGAGRARVLREVATVLEQRRPELLETMASECGKTIAEGDPEVSEAVDFASWYADLAEELDAIDGALYSPCALTAVVPPWNFPVAIPAGSTLAALAAGSSVVLKPAPQARRCGAVLAKAMWDAGVPTDVLRLVNLDEAALGKALITDPRVDRVILTGSWDTAALFRTYRPDLPLLAETSGKNAIVVTPHADIDLAVRDIVRSAFGHAGQKCSATSLVITVGSVSKSERFRRQLVDAVTSLRVGPASDAATQMGPLIEPPSTKLAEALTKLGPGETWLVQPRQIDERTWTPGVREGVRPGSPFHLTEYFGPVLGIMSAATLQEAISWQNGTDFGLTAGLHSLDPDEISTWLDAVEAGNLYVNRTTTGAIVRRQPFGGLKKSSVGPGTKAGGPDYLLGLGDWGWTPARASVVPPADLLDFIARLSERFRLSSDEAMAIRRAAFSDQTAWRDQYANVTDVSGLSSECNVLRYLPARPQVRLASAGVLSSFVRVLTTARLVGGATISVPNAAVADALTAEGFEVEVLDDATWQRQLAAGPARRVRLIGATASEVNVAIGGRPDIVLYDQPVTESGRLELQPFVREQAISITSHRFGTPIELPAVNALVPVPLVQNTPEEQQ